MSDSKVIFTTSEDEKLVERVKNYPCLFDVNCVAYKDLLIKDRAWREISIFLERSAQDCKKRWRNIRDTYNRRIRTGKGSGISNKQKWALAGMLGFLDKIQRQDDNLSTCDYEISQSENYENDHFNIEDKNIIQDFASHSILSMQTDHELIIPEGSNNRKRNLDEDLDATPYKRDSLSDNTIRLMLEKHSAALKRLEHNNEDAVDLFFRSIASSVKHLRQDLVNEAKMRSLQLVFELEQRNATAAYCSRDEVESPSGSINIFDSTHEVFEIKHEPM